MWLCRIKALENLVERLATRIEIIEQRYRCSQGLHEWQLTESHYRPVIRCVHCYVEPKEEKK